MKDMRFSARRRRWLLWAAGLGVAVLAGVLVWQFVPNEKGGDISAPTQTGPVKTVARVRQVPVTAQRRAAIDATLAKFVPLAMGRRNPAAARGYVTANLW